MGQDASLEGTEKTLSEAFAMRIMRLLKLFTLVTVLSTFAVAQPLTGPAEYSHSGGLYTLQVPAGWSAIPEGANVTLRKTGTGLQPRMSVRLERGGYTPTKDSLRKDFEQFEKMFTDHKFKVLSIKPVKVGKMKGYRLIGTEKSKKIFNTHIMQKLAVPGGQVLDAHGRSEASSQTASKAGSKELESILKSMKAAKK